ncbi:acyl-CoA thioester hydrolase [Thalassovita litoralis]|jgi:acyl-CoA thioester hydrolase|uniref:Acyl-CoA thioester hydrolase n=1 Tax=Thalassovita litoralis TaxID=1010611 RepID=A0A521BL47_9RHOB|nr:thioesterase family protein [Thalassovita litoralis]SMO47884.1 acyl-CoA thioester hydrolase [Thalassovita litoralis]
MTHPTRTRRADYADFYQIQTRWMDNDMYGHMNNVVHYSLFDTAVNGWLIAKGALDPMRSDSYGLVVETGCKYYAEMGFPDLVTAGIRITKLGSSSVRYEVGLFRNDADEAAAEGFFVHVYVNQDSHRPTPIEGERRAILETLLVDQS